jgi:hypothetical protein
MGEFVVTIPIKIILCIIYIAPIISQHLSLKLLGTLLMLYRQRA